MNEKGASGGRGKKNEGGPERRTTVRALALSAALLTALSRPDPSFAGGEEPEGASFVRNVLGHAWGDLQYGFYHAQEKRWLWQGPVILGSTALGAGLAYAYADSSVRESIYVYPKGSAMDRFSTVGGYVAYAVPAGFLGTGLFLPRGGRARTKTLQVAEELCESLGYTVLATVALKYSVRRSRPDGGSLSFPSGHASTAFSVAGTLAQNYPWYVGGPGLAFAAALAFSRLALDVHHLSDVLAGAGLGLFFSTSVRSFHAAIPKGRRWILHGPAPLLDRGTAGLLWSGAF